MPEGPTDRRQRLSALFELICRSSPRGSGALHFGGDRLGGAVLFDVGRVCWAAVPGAGRRLTDLVSSAARVPRATIEDAYAACRASGARVGEVLVARNVVSAEQLRALLLVQTAETLVTLADGGAEPVWVPHRSGGYQPRFTFPVAEVVAAAAATGLALDPTAARAELARVVDGWGVGAAFDVAGHPLPFAVGGEADDYELLCGLGEWAAHALRGWRAEAAPRFALADLGGGGVVAWRAHEAVLGAQFATPSGLARVLAHLARSP